MFRFDRIGTPIIHGGNITAGTSTSTTTNTNSSNLATMVGHVINAAPGTIAGRDAFDWNALLAPTASHKFFIGQQFTLTKKQLDNSQGLELTGTLHTTVPEYVSTVPIFGELVAAGGSALASVTMADVPSFLGPSVQAVGSTLRTRAQSYAAPVNLVSDDAAGTYLHGFLFSWRDASAPNIDRIMTRFAFRTGEPDPNTRDFDIRR